MTETLPVKKDQTRSDIRSFIEDRRDQIAAVLPSHLKADRMLRVLLSALNTTPKLLNCTKVSLWNAMMKCSQYGLEPDGRMAHLIPFGDQCQVIFDYKGIVDIVRRSGEVKQLTADVVYEADMFVYSKGDGGRLYHEPNFKASDRGKVVAAYSYVVLSNGQPDYHAMPYSEIEKTRLCSKSANNGPWITFWNEMAKKTVFRQHSKWLPCSPELREKISADDEDQLASNRMDYVKPVFAAPTSLLGSIEAPPEIPTDSVASRATKQKQSPPAPSKPPTTPPESIQASKDSPAVSESPLGLSDLRVSEAPQTPPGDAHPDSIPGEPGGDLFQEDQEMTAKEALKMRLAESDIKDMQLFAWGVLNKQWPGKIKTIDQLWEINPAKVEWCLNNFGKISEAIFQMGRPK